MTDRYIDQEETLIYGPHAAKMIRKHVVGLVSELDGALNFFANQIEAATAHMEQMLDGARSADSAIRQGKSDRISMLGQTNTLLNRFSSHLDAHPPGIVDRKVFFVEDGTVSGIGNAGPKVLRAVTRITEKLAKEDSPVRDRAAWHAEFSTVMTGLAGVIDHAGDVRTGRRDATPTVEAARISWLNTYRAAREQVTAALRFAGKLHLLATIFHDLSVPTNTKVKAIVTDETGDPDPNDPRLG